MCVSVYVRFLTVLPILPGGLQNTTSFGLVVGAMVF